MTILVVDDDRDVQELLRVALVAEGHEVACVPNGREALHYLRSHAGTDAILLDLLLPIMDGAAFRAAQLRDRSLGWIPIIVMSGAVDAASRARQLAAWGIVRKPLDIDEVRRAVRYVELAARNRRPLSSN